MDENKDIHKGVVVAAFVLCWLPLHVAWILFAQGNRMLYEISQHFNLASMLLFYLGASLNPVLYNMLQKHKKSVCQFLHCSHNSPSRPLSRSHGTRAEVPASEARQRTDPLVVHDVHPLKTETLFHSKPDLSLKLFVTKQKIKRLEPHTKKKPKRKTKKYDGIGNRYKAVPLKHRSQLVSLEEKNIF
ncbi:hypothetical protein JRQ81_007133 [Phrynocephalus forsythii]|uniref:G-protein coupled receptors family 1 profile domain-containing protein n=1 Tax=Phrynocephalus forsythii TaxID=171643 RepID=A0A9Q1ATX5_9SAUR|nr:hypothetical protein JRQ81_007133 [Phrynocephalus forsythii]